MKNRLIYYLTHPRAAALWILTRFFTWLPDRLYLKIMYRCAMGKRLNLKNPQTFSEKLQWLKLYDRQPEYTTMVDKYAAKEYVASKIGAKYIIPTLGVWDRPEEIEWDKLPDRFVLKTTHDSGGVVICKDKSRLDKAAAMKKLEWSLQRDYYQGKKEWPYKNVPRRIIAEAYIDPAPNTEDLVDYKWYCFDGEPKYCQVIQDRHTQETIDFFDTEWRHQEFIGLNPNVTQAAYIPTRPRNLDLQIRIARELSKGMPYSRIDLYEVGEREYFGEITFYPHSGLGQFRPEQYDLILGQMVKLPGMQRGGVKISVLQNDRLQILPVDLPDYKFFCFGGEPRYCQVITGRESEMCIDFFDKDWHHQPFHEPKNYPFAEPMPEKPTHYEQMWQAARTLAEGKAFSRIDFYNVRGAVYFGEITFYPTSGIGGFDPEEYDLAFGKMIDLQDIRMGGVLD